MRNIKTGNKYWMARWFGDKPELVTVKAIANLYGCDFCQTDKDIIKFYGTEIFHENKIDCLKYMRDEAKKFVSKYKEEVAKAEKIIENLNNALKDRV